jgi:hypothetical protein
MTETENKYYNGKIYTIRSHMTDKYYIGSTCSSLYKRLYEHRSDYKRQRFNVSSYEILKYDDNYIELLENFKCENKNELNKREGELIRLHKDNIVNMCIPTRTRKERDNDNKDKLKDYRKQYRQDNKDKIKEQRTTNFKCECGNNYIYQNKARHLKTIKHTNFINQTITI